MPPPKLAWPLLALSLAAAATAGAQCPPGVVPASQARFAAVSIRNASPASFQPTETDPGHVRISGLSLRRIIMTNAVDLATENQVLGRILAGRRERVTVLITHRPSVAALATKVAWLEHDELAAIGRHEDLLAERPGYSETWGLAPAPLGHTAYGPEGDWQ